MKKILITVISYAFVILCPTEGFSQENTGNKLNNILNYTFENNQDIRKNISSINYAKGDVIQSSVLPNPELSVDISEFGGTGQYTGSKNSEVSFMVNQEIEVANKRKYRKEVANYNLLIAKQNITNNIQQILLNAEKEYVRFLIAKKVIKISEKRLEIANKTHDTIEKMVRKGAASDSQHTKYDITLEKVNISKAKANSEFKIAKLNLSKISGVKDLSLYFDDNYLNKDIEDLNKNLFLKNLNELPKVQILKLQNQRANSKIKLEKAYAVPNPSFGIGVTQYNETDDNAILANFSIPIPILNQNRGNIQKAMAEKLMSESQEKSELLNINNLGEKLYDKFVYLKQISVSYRDSIIPNANKAYLIAIKNYEIGQASILDLLDAEKTLYELEDNYLQNLVSLYEAKAEIKFVMGSYKKFVENKIINSRGVM